MSKRDPNKLIYTEYWPGPAYGEVIFTFGFLVIGLVIFFAIKAITGGAP